MHTLHAEVINLGCRVNRVESDMIERDLVRAGFSLAAADTRDVVVINTCAVTGEAEAKTRKAVRRALALPGNPLVLVTGCAVNLNAAAYESLSHRVLAEPQKTRVVSRLCSALKIDVTHLRGHAPVDMLSMARVGIKIQDGCNHRCSYCIVWKARGREQSMAVDDILRDVEEAAQRGAAEVVLTGVNLGTYHALTPAGARIDLAELLYIIAEKTTIPQIRISSIEPMDVHERLIEAMATLHQKVAPFVHLPLQSGSNATLRRMHRPYSVERVFALAEQLRAQVPQIALSTDVIAGFPGETDDEFEESLSTCKQLGFSRMHVFRFSPRPGTPAADMENQIAPELKAERALRLRVCAEQMARADALKRVGSVERAIFETGRMATLGSFHRVICDDEDFKLDVPALHQVRLHSIDEQGTLYASLCHA
ncbi:MiaB/RimO family radical SAM methylthiotransferase [Collinsella sp. zg1085]|uniref:MiaB/RimO family radical SAM methylthiotransferase n=1 Tax=Collinsella sp. zg1085 TaxID=2844380 RepID=UPI001C0CC30F|nr:MiaB/RimO family radical SAM methylthiotransferase [Collinsella sp. zg1085]QWT16980.1 MiaB/RimO family radical SAM methylthiotransferase [Collinsella sp. zg1085]